MCPRRSSFNCYSVFVKRSSFKSLLNLRKAYIFQEFAEGLLSICVCWIFQNVHLSKVSAAVVPQSKSTELCSSAAVVPQSKSTEMWSSAAPFHRDLWYFRLRTNEHFTSMLFIGKTYKQPTVASLKSLKSTHSALAGEWFPYDSWTFFLSDPAPITAIVAIIWKLSLIHRNNHPPFLLNSYLYALQTYRTHSSKLQLLLVL